MADPFGSSSVGQELALECVSGAIAPGKTVYKMEKPGHNDWRRLALREQR